MSCLQMWFLPLNAILSLGQVHINEGATVTAKSVNFDNGLWHCIVKRSTFTTSSYNLVILTFQYPACYMYSIINAVALHHCTCKKYVKCKYMNLDNESTCLSKDWKTHILIKYCYGIKECARFHSWQIYNWQRHWWRIVLIYHPTHQFFIVFDATGNTTLKNKIVIY